MKKKTTITEDAELWNALTESLRPLKRARHRVTHPLKLEPRQRPMPASQIDTPVSPKPTSSFKGNLDGLNGNDARRLKSGKIKPDIVLDLHGMRRKEALSITRSHVMSAYTNRQRTVQIITGKGLRQIYTVVFDWLHSEEAKQAVAAVVHAPRHQGGDGALLVRIRRIRDTH